MILAALPLIPVVYAAVAAGAAGVAGWIRGRSKKASEMKKQDEKVEHLESMVQEVIDRQKAAEETTEENVESGETETLSADVFEQVYQSISQTFDEERKKSAEDALSEDPMAPSNESPEEDDYPGDDRFELLDL